SIQVRQYGQRGAACSESRHESQLDNYHNSRPDPLPRSGRLQPTTRSPLCGRVGLRNRPALQCPALHERRRPTRAERSQLSLGNTLAKQATASKSTTSTLSRKVADSF